MTNSFKRQADEIWSVIQTHQKFLLSLHVSPDADSVGSCLAFLWLLKSLGKQVTLIKGDSPLPDWAQFLPGGELILNKNITEINFSDYEVFLILDSSSPVQITRLTDLKFPPELSRIIIDHHFSNSGFAQINFIDSNYPAVGQMVYDLAKYWQLLLTPEISTNLIAAIYTDTGGFQYAPTSSATFSAMAELTTIYPEFSTLINNLENHNSPSYLKLLSLALNRIQVFNHVAISCVTYQDLVQNLISPKDYFTDTTANYLKSVVGWDICVAMLETEPNCFKCSLRTRNFDLHDVAKIAMTTGFGGGHRAAAGATLKMPVDQAKKLLLDTVFTLYPDLQTV